MPSIYADDNYRDIIFWDPYGGNDGFDGTTLAKAVKTFARAHTLATSDRGSVIQAICTNPAGIHTVDEQCVVSKNHIALRGPGWQLKITSSSLTGNTIEVSGIHCEVANIQVSTAATGTIQRGVYITGNYSFMQHVWCSTPRRAGFYVAGASFVEIIDCYSDASATYGITLGDNSFDCLISGNRTFNSTLGGIRTTGTSARHSIFDNRIIQCGAYGIHLESGSSRCNVYDNHIDQESAIRYLDEGTNNTVSTDSDDVRLSKQLLKNRLELSEAPSSNWILYADDGVTVLQRWSVVDKLGNPIILGTGYPAKRTPV